MGREFLQEGIHQPTELLGKLPALGVPDERLPEFSNEDVLPPLKAALRELAVADELRASALEKLLGRLPARCFQERSADFRLDRGIGFGMGAVWPRASGLKA